MQTSKSYKQRVFNSSFSDRATADWILQPSLCRSKVNRLSLMKARLPQSFFLGAGTTFIHNHSFTHSVIGDLSTRVQQCSSSAGVSYWQGAASNNDHDNLSMHRRKVKASPTVYNGPLNPKLYHCMHYLTTVVSLSPLHTQVHHEAAVSFSCH